MVETSYFIDGNRSLYHQRVRFLKCDRPGVQEYVVTLPLASVTIRDLRMRLCQMTKTSPNDLRMTIVDNGHFTNPKLDDKDDLLRLPLLDHEVTLYAYDLPRPKTAADGTIWELCPVFQRLKIQQEQHSNNNNNINEKDHKHNSSTTTYVYGIPTFVYLKIGLINNLSLLEACRQAIVPFVQPSVSTPPDVNVYLVTPSGSSLHCHIEPYDFLLTQFTGSATNRWALCVQWVNGHQYNLKVETPIIPSSSSSPAANEMMTCIVCLTRPRSKLFLPCGHFCYCDTCLDEARRTSITPERPAFLCCICRAPVTTVQKVHFA